jgi:hypothetical protein
MLTQAWRRECRLPADPKAIRQVVGCSLREWRRCWPKIEKYWRVEGDALVPVEALGFARPWPGQNERRHIPLAVRREVFARDGVCVWCAAQERLELDHIVPYSRGGPDTVDNLRVLCKPCNVRRGADRASKPLLQKRTPSVTATES